MSRDFERIKREISGYSILVTSWYDEQQKSWRASAPRYAHLRELFSADQGMCSSRNEAIDQVIRVLTLHFAQEEDAPSEGLFFL